MQEIVRLIDFLNRIRYAVEPVINTHLYIDLDMFNGSLIIKFSYQRFGQDRIGYAYDFTELELSNVELLNYRSIEIIRSLKESIF